ncbi:MAG: hypothetical protein ACYS7Y_05680, partial [Planctomycetota bacterium]
MERRWVVIGQAICRVLGLPAAAIFLFAAAGCHIVDDKSPWKRYYDADKYGKYGAAEKKISEHFNLHRGRWWNYYTRGACYLEHRHYKKAQEDFDRVIKIRPRETRDARTYGMHFMDYFPHREMGIAYYLEGMSLTGEDVAGELLRARKEELFENACDKLTKSLEQGETPRAKDYLNRATKALFRTNRKDTIGPVVHVTGPIYTNERKFQLALTVTDDLSGVEEIWISPPDGGVDVERPRLLTELADKEVTETVELAIDPGRKNAVVGIEAFDLAGNRSDRYRLDIRVDTQAPVAAITVVGDVRWRGRFAALVHAVDDRGLREIRAGGQQNDRLRCYGETRYRGTVFGTPVNGELNIHVVDIAGNTVSASIPVGYGNSRAALPQAPRGRTQQMFPLALRLAASDWDARLSPEPLARFGVHRPGKPAWLYWGGHARPDPPVLFGTWMATEAAGPKKPWFHFENDVRRTDGKPKETTLDRFVVEGSLRNARGVTAIKVGDADVYRAMPGTTLEGSGGDLFFNHKVDLNDDTIDIPQSVTIQAFRGTVCCAETLLKVVRRKNCVRDKDAVYCAVLLLKTANTGCRWTSVKSVVPKDIYNTVLGLLSELNAEDPYCREQQSRIAMRDLTWATEGESYEAAARRSADKLREKVLADCDLIIRGDVGVYVSGGEEQREIKLRAMDVTTGENLYFQPAEESGSVILAQTHLHRAPSGDLRDARPWAEIRDDALATAVRKKLPRVQAAVLPTGISGSTVTINRGIEDRLFKAMSLCFYTYGDAARDVNIYLKKV